MLRLDLCIDFHLLLNGFGCNFTYAMCLLWNVVPYCSATPHDDDLCEAHPLDRPTDSRLGDILLVAVLDEFDHVAAKCNRVAGDIGCKTLVLFGGQELMAASWFRLARWNWSAMFSQALTVVLGLPCCKTRKEAHLAHPADAPFGDTEVFGDVLGGIATEEAGSDELALLLGGCLT